MDKQALPRRRVFLIDDHPVVRQGLTELLDQESDLEVCGEATGSAEALRSLVDIRPDLIVLDLSLKTGDGIDLIKRLRTEYPETAVLVLTMHDGPFFAERALRAGAQGYLTKREASDRVLTAIRELLDGEMYVSERLSPTVLQRLLFGKSSSEGDATTCLSERELQVFQLIGHGMGVRQIARELDLSPKTIETYRANIKDKLQLRDSRDVMRRAVEWVVGNEDA